MCLYNDFSIAIFNYMKGYPYDDEIDKGEAVDKTKHKTIRDFQVTIFRLLCA